MSTVNCYTQQRADPGRLVYLLGVGDTPLSTQQGCVMAPVNRPLDRGRLHEQEEEFSGEDENIDPASYAQPQPQIEMAPGTSVFPQSRISLI